MKERKVVKMKKHNIVCGVLTVLSLVTFIISSILLTSNKYFDIIGRYKPPICVVDLHSFKSDTCEECGKSIQEVGVLYRLGESYNYEIEDELPRLDFKNYFKSYDGYISIKNEILILAPVVLLSFLIFVVAIVIDLVLFVKCKKKGDASK